jgi:hypothetical protein
MTSDAKMMRYLLSILLLLSIISPSSGQAGDKDWLLFRGGADLAGRFDSDFRLHHSFNGALLRMLQQNPHPSFLMA